MHRIDGIRCTYQSAPINKGDLESAGFCEYCFFFENSSSRSIFIILMASTREKIIYSLTEVPGQPLIAEKVFAADYFLTS